MTVLPTELAEIRWNMRAWRHEISYLLAACLDDRLSGMLPLFIYSRKTDEHF